MSEFVVIDLETTGLDPEQDKIIEVAAVKIRRGLIVDQYTSLIDCGFPISDFVSDLTGITNEMLQNQPHIEDIIPSLEEFIGEAVICAHNAEFDSAFLHKTWDDPREWLDTITLAQIAYPCCASYSLAWLTGMLAIENTSAHRALADALATAELLIQAKNTLKKLPEKARQDLLTLAGDNSGPLDQLLRQECGLPSAAAAEMQARPRRTYPAQKKSDVNEQYRIKLTDIDRYLSGDGEFAARLEGFEDRPQQLAMSKAVAETFNQQGFLLAEAGTGTGKSLAYLLPAALFAEGSGKKVAISTHTKNLQEQLLNKDIPLLSQLLNKPLTAAVLKGRSNYLCRRLYNSLLKQPPENLRYFLMRVAVWQAGSSSGDGDELMLNGYEQWRWQRVCASKENCAMFCPFRKSGGCNVQKSRIAANNSDIYILNHSLLVANAAMETAFLPPFSYLVIDEAHHLEKAAEEQLAANVDFYAILNLLGRLKRRERGKETGALLSLRHYATGVFLSQLTQQMLNKHLDDLDGELTATLTAAEEFFALVTEFFKQDASKELFYPATVRILSKHYRQEDWPLLLSKGEELAEALNQLARLAFRIQDLLQSEEEEDREEEQHIPGKDELQSIGGNAREMAATLKACLKQDQDNYVSWVRFADAEKKPSLHTAPIELGELLRNCLYEHCDAAVLTSATLAAGKSFAYFKQRVGLDLLPDAPQELTVPSPFAYKEQALFTIVDDLPDWSKASDSVTVQALSQCLIQLLEASRGRAIVLFTSHQQLRAVFNEIRHPLLEKGIKVLAHGVSGGPVQLLQRLQTEENCAILGANSFWEGVDVKGCALSLIVIVRLPFWPPNTPVTAAKMERIEAAGRSSFSEYSLPQAILRFKQGFGRLIRSSEDSGVFCVLDKRLLEKGYGRNFLRSVPEMKRVHGSSAEIAAQIHHWLE